MSRQLIGAYLGRIVPLSSHDIAEIVEEQFASGRRFGEAALALRLCRPHHVWKAWWEQLGESLQTVDLNVLGVDTQALAHVPASAARAFGVIPLRVVRDELVLAASSDSIAVATEQLATQLQKNIRFVQAPAEQIALAIERYYLNAPATTPLEQTEAVVASAA